MAPGQQGRKDIHPRYQRVSLLPPAPGYPKDEAVELSSLCKCPAPGCAAHVFSGGEE